LPLWSPLVVTIRRILGALPLGPLIYSLPTQTLKSFYPPKPSLQGRAPKVVSVCSRCGFLVETFTSGLLTRTRLWIRWNVYLLLPHSRQSCLFIVPRYAQSSAYLFFRVHLSPPIGCNCDGSPLVGRPDEGETETLARGCMLGVVCPLGTALLFERNSVFRNNNKTSSSLWVNSRSCYLLLM
jgi:hypothetical protein